MPPEFPEGKIHYPDKVGFDTGMGCQGDHRSLDVDLCAVRTAEDPAGVAGHCPCAAPDLVHGEAAGTGVADAVAIEVTAWIIAFILTLSAPSVGHYHNVGHVHFAVAVQVAEQGAGR